MALLGDRPAPGARPLARADEAQSGSPSYPAPDMTDQMQDFLVISRGQWDADASPEAIQSAIDGFYDWFDRNVAAGRMRGGSRLKPAGATVTRKGIVTDGPFGETKELIGGFWMVSAPTLEAAARLLAESPTVALGLFYEVRPLDAKRATATMQATETAGR